MLIPYSVDVPMERWPIANLAVISITIAVSIWVFDKPPETVSDLDALIALHGWETQPDYSKTSFVLAREGTHFKQWFGHMLAHGDFGHLLGNMFFLFVFGNAVNVKLGNVVYPIFYVIAGLMAAVSWKLFGDGAAAVGASGAICGVTGAFLILFPLNDTRVAYFTIWRWGVVTVSSMWVLLLYLAYDIYGMISGAPRVAFVAHIGGTVTGVTLATAFVLKGFIQSESYEKNMLELFGWRGRG